jgi:hypothetical protein
VAGGIQSGLDSGVALYDTLFVEVAAQRDLELAPFDAAPFKKSPDIAQRPRAFLSK